VNEFSTTRHAAPSIVCLAIFASTACSSSDSKTSGSSSSEIELTATTANNYSFNSKFTLANSSIADKSVLTFNWSTMTKDMYKRTIDPKTDVGAILVTIWGYTKSDLESKINNDQLMTTDRKGAGYLFTQGLLDTTTTDSLTTDGSTPLPAGTEDSYFSTSNFPAPDYTFLVMIQSNQVNIGKDALMMTTFSLSTDTISPTTVTIDDTSTDLQFAADFSKLTPMSIPAGTNNVVIDWSSLTQNAMGRVLDDDARYKITRVLVASYSKTTAELQTNQNFTGLESLADAKWESKAADITSTKLSLSKLANSNGAAFSGIDAAHTWILALECGECLNPAPWYITELQTSSK
jgi:hypothetical protein